MFRSLVSGVTAIMVIVASAGSSWAGKEVWEAPLSHTMTWSKVSSYGTLIVGSNSSIASFNPETGAKLWEREDLTHLAPFDVREVPGFPVLIIGKDKGMGGSSAEVEAVSLSTGETLWKTDRINGAPLGVYPVPGRALVLLFANVSYDKEGGPTGTNIFAFDVNTGELKWETNFEKKVGAIPLHLIDNSGMFYVRMDLSGYQDPVFEGDRAYLSFKGLTALDLNSGKILWEVPFRPAHKSYKKAYATPVIAGDTIYATGAGVIYAANKDTGELKWKTTAISSGLISELTVLDEMVLARVGGNFFNPGAKAYTLDKPLAVYAYNKADGAVLWQYAGIKNGITNMVYVPGQDFVFLADSTSLIGIDTKSSGKVKESFRLPLEFKRKVGAADITSAGVKALTGGLTGMIGAGIKLGAGKERQDPPVSVEKIADENIVVRGEQHILSFNPKTQAINWSLSYAAPGASAFGVALMAGVTVFSAVSAQYSAAAGQTSSSAASQQVSNAFKSMDRYIDKRFSKTKAAQEHAYILTNISDGEDKGIGIMAIRLSDGETDGQYIFNNKQPEYTVDTLDGRLYYFPGKSKIVAYDL